MENWVKTTHMSRQKSQNDSWILKSERAQQGELIELGLIKIGSVEPKLWTILTIRLEKKKKKKKKTKKKKDVENQGIDRRLLR